MSRVNDFSGVTVNQIYKKQTAYSKLSRVPSRVVAREVSREGLEGLGLFGSRNGFGGGDEAGDGRTGMEMSSGLAGGMGWHATVLVVGFEVVLRGSLTL
jgi:hypothetical protein